MGVTWSFDVVADTARARGQLNKFNTDSQRMKGKVQTNFGAMGAAIKTAFAFVGVRAIARFSNDLYDLGRQVEAWGVKSEAVFGDEVSAIEKWAADNRRLFGVGEQALIGYTTEVGQMLAAQGFAGEKLSGLSTEVAEMAGNASLLSGGTVSMTDALGKFTAMLRGERDPVESLGVSIKQSGINAYLAANGMEDLTGEALKMAEASAAIAIAQEQLADQFAETGEIGGEEARAMGSDWETLKEDIGTAVYGIGQEITGGLYDFVYGEGDAWWGRMGRRFQDGWGDLTAGLDEFGRLWSAGWSGMAADTDNWLGKIIHKYAAFVETMSRFWGRFFELVRFGAGLLYSYIAWIGGAIGAVISGITRGISVVQGGLSGIAHIAGLPGFAEGGVVGGPKGSAQLAMVHGGETILPTHKAGGGSGVGSTYNITVSAATASPAEVGQAIVDSIREYELYGGSGWRAA